MKAFPHLWQYLAKFFLEWEIFYTNDIEKNKTHFMFSDFFRKSHRLWYNAEKYGGTRGTTNDVTTWSIRVTCWINKATQMHALALTHTHTRSRARAHARTCERIHTQICNICFFSTATMIRERTSVLRHTYIASLCYWLKKFAFSFLKRENPNFDIAMTYL
jgi:hypothetical protein